MDSTTATIILIKIVKKKRERWSYILTIKNGAHMEGWGLKVVHKMKLIIREISHYRSEACDPIFISSVFLADTILCLAVGKEIQMKDHGSQSWWKY